MTITPEQAAALEAEDRHLRAQVQVYAWMERAEQHQAAADYVASLEERPDGWEQIANTGVGEQRTENRRQRPCRR